MKLTEAIYCKTEEESRKICGILHEQGLTWYGGESYMDDFPPSMPTSEIVFYPSDGVWGHATDHEGSKATPAAEVIRQHKSEVATESILTPGTCVRAWNELEEHRKQKGLFVGYTSKAKPVVELGDITAIAFDYVEPYNEKEEKVKKVKELMTDLGITKEDL